MPARDLLAAYQQEQQYSAVNVPGNYDASNSTTTLQNDAGQSGAHQIEMGSMPGLDEFLHAAEQIQSNLMQIQKNTNKLSQMHRQALVESNQTQLANMTRQIDQLTEETSDLIVSSRSTVKSMRSKPAPTKAEAQIQLQQQKGLASRLMEAAQQFQTVQKEAKQNYRTQVVRQYQTARPGATLAEAEAAVDNTSGPIFQQELMSRRVGQQQEALQQVQTRHEEIVRINKSVEELFVLFQEMQSILDQQQDQIDVVEQAVVETDTNIASGHDQMTKAIRSAKSARKLKIILFILLLVIAGIIALVVVLQVRKNSNNSPSSST